MYRAFTMYRAFAMYTVCTMYKICSMYKVLFKSNKVQCCKLIFLTQVTIEKNEKAMALFIQLTSVTALTSSSVSAEPLASLRCANPEEVYHHYYHIGLESARSFYHTTSLRPKLAFRFGFYKFLRRVQFFFFFLYGQLFRDHFFARPWWPPESVPIG